MHKPTRIIFHSHDDTLSSHLTNDNQGIEPEWYCPIIFTILVNAADGIDTGWMTRIPIKLKRILDGEEPITMLPWFKGSYLYSINLRDHFRASSADGSFYLMWQRMYIHPECVSSFKLESAMLFLLDEVKYLWVSGENHPGCSRLPRYIAL